LYAVLTQAMDEALATTSMDDASVTTSWVKPPSRFKSKVWGYFKIQT